MGSIACLAEAVKQVDMSGVRPQLVEAIRLLRQHGLSLSDRRLVKSQKLIAAATVLSGRDVATEADLWPLLYVLPTQAMQVAARGVLQGLLASACSLHLHAAVEQSVQQPKSRESRLLERAAELLAAEDAEPVQVEAVLKEIDANFDADSLAPALAQVRQQLVSTLEHAHTND
jgi:MoxR-like ATPase